MLDSVIDHQRDLRTGTPWYLQHYDQQHIDQQVLSNVARTAIEQTRPLPDSGHHMMTLVGVVAYYTSAPEADEEQAKPLVAHIQHQLQPIMAPTLAVMSTWRAVKNLRRSVKRNTGTEA
jgi:hypothetical protein